MRLIAVAILSVAFTGCSNSTPQSKEAAVAAAPANPAAVPPVAVAPTKEQPPPAVAAAQPAPPAEKQKGRVDAATEWFALGDLDFNVMEAKVENIAFRDRAGVAQETKEKYLRVSIVVAVRSELRKYDHTPFDRDFSGRRITATDHVKNVYSVPRIEGIIKLAGPSDTVPVTSEKSLLDTIYLEKPIPAAEYIDLDLTTPKDGVVKFRIPAKMWKGPEKK